MEEFKCNFCDEVLSNQKLFFRHIKISHPVSEIITSSGVSEFWQENILIASKSDKCILKNCNTRIQENEKKKNNQLFEPCTRFRLSSTISASLFLTLDQDDMKEGIFLCKPHLKEKKNLDGIFFKVGFAVAFTPNFNSPKPIKASNIPPSSKNYNKRIVVNTFACTSFPMLFVTSQVEQLTEQIDGLKNQLEDYKKKDLIIQDILKENKWLKNEKEKFLRQKKMLNKLLKCAFIREKKFTMH